MTGEVDWYGEDVLAVCLDVGDDTLTALAFVAEGEAKIGASVDTGFMRNAIYTIPVDGSATPGNPSGMYQSPKSGGPVQRTRTGTPKMPPHTAGVHAAAVYTIYQEMKLHFMYRGLQKAVRSVGGVLTTIARGRGL